MTGEWMPVVLTATLVVLSLVIAVVVSVTLARASSRKRNALEAAVGGGRAVSSMPPGSGEARLPKESPDPGR